jgi:hypothetical protein
MFVQCIMRCIRRDQQYALVVPLLYSTYWFLHVSAVAGIRFPDRLARRVSLYRLRYRASICSCIRSMLRVKEQRNIVHEISKRKAKWIGHIFGRNCLLRQVIEGKIKGRMKVTERGGRRRT